MHRQFAVLMLILVFSLPLAAQSATGSLHVTAVVVSSSELIRLPDGSFQLVVYNAPQRSEALAVQLAINRPSPSASLFYSQNSVTVAPRTQPSSAADPAPLTASARRPRAAR